MASTFFFRDTHTLYHAARILTPEVTGRSRIRIWDAGCATGPEPYTLAMILADTWDKSSFNNLNISATDIDENDEYVSVLENGIYPDDEAKLIPEAIFNKYCIELPDPPGCFKVNGYISERIQFQKHNLLTLEPIGQGFSLIVCKNVLLHFQQSERLEVIKMFHKALDLGGFLATENTQKMPPELSHLFVQEVSDAQLFRKI